MCFTSSTKICAHFVWGFIIILNSNNISSLLPNKKCVVYGVNLRSWSFRNTWICFLIQKKVLEKEKFELEKQISTHDDFENYIFVT